MPLFHLLVPHRAASVCNVMDLGVLNTYLVAVAALLPFVRGDLCLRYSHVQARPFFGSCAHRTLPLRGGPSFFYCWGSEVAFPDGIGFAACFHGGSSRLRWGVGHLELARS